MMGLVNPDDRPLRAVELLIPPASFTAVGEEKPLGSLFEIHISLGDDPVVT